MLASDVPFEYRIHLTKLPALPENVERSMKIRVVMPVEGICGEYQIVVNFAKKYVGEQSYSHKKVQKKNVSHYWIMEILFTIEQFLGPIDLTK